MLAPKKPREYQLECVDAFVRHYYVNNEQRGILSMFCGTGKSYVMYLMAREIYKRHVDVRTTVLLVTPFVDLVAQLARNIISYHDSQDFDLDVCYAASINISRFGVKRFDGFNHARSRQLLVIITTYASLTSKTSEVYRFLCSGHVVDFIMFDEAHNIGSTKHRSLASIDLADRQECKILFATATPLTYPNTEYIDGEELGRFDMKNKDTYGNIFYSLSYSRAMTLVDNGARVLTPYKVLFMKFDDSWKDDKLPNRPDLNSAVYKWFFVNAMRLGVRRTIIYTSKIANATAALRLIEMACAELETAGKAKWGAYTRPRTKLYHGEIEVDERACIRDEFSDNYIGMRIIVTVQAMNEGVDLPCCDSILFTYDKKSKESTIVQNIGRALRRDPANPNKVAYIFLPTGISAYTDHCGSTLFRGPRQVLTELMKSTKEYYSAKSIHSVDCALVGRALQNREKEERENVNKNMEVDVTIWDPIEDKFISSTDVNVVSDSIAELSLESVREQMLFYLDGIAVHEAMCDKQLMNCLFYPCLRRATCKTQLFTTWGHLLYNKYVASPCYLRERVLPIRKEFDLMRNEGAVYDECRSRLASMGIIDKTIGQSATKRHKTDKYGVTVDIEKTRALRAYINTRVLELVFEGDEGALTIPPHWAWKRIYAHNIDSGESFADLDTVYSDEQECKIDRDNTRCDTTRHTTGEKLDKVLIDRWNPFKLPASVAATITGHIEKLSGVDLSGSRLECVYKIDAKGECGGKIVFKKTKEKDVSITFGGRLNAGRFIDYRIDKKCPELHKIVSGLGEQHRDLYRSAMDKTVL